MNSEVEEARIQRAIVHGCSICDRKRHYFDQFHSPGAADRIAALVDQKMTKYAQLADPLLRARVAGEMTAQLST